MSKFDTSGWKNFKLSDLFEISGSKTTPKNELEKIGSGNYPYVTTQATTNGIAGYYATYTEKGHCLTIDSAVLGTCFYQEFDFSASDHVEILRPKFAMSKEVAIFFTILINKVGNILGYAYNKKRSQKALKEESLSLPVNQNGEIDFEFMEKTIKNTKSKMQNILNTYKSLIQRERESKIWNLDFSPNHTLSLQERSFIEGGTMQIAVHLAKSINCEWREFNLTELFTYERGTRLTKNNRVSGKYPLVTAGEYNKGVKEYISNENQKVFSNAITIDMFCNSFVHIDEFCCDDNVLVLTSNLPISKEAMIFISAIINQDKEKWGYEKQYRQNSLEKHKILLPIDKFGNPNFEIMENFIKEIEQNHTAKLLAYYRHITARWGEISKFEISDYLNLTQIRRQKKILWREFLFKDLFENIKQGARLKSADHIKGNLPFVMAGTINAGISGYIGNENVRKFNANAITIDIFGNTFYRNYEFGASDDVGVFWNNTKQINQNAMIFIASVISKQLQGKFDFSNKLRASQTYDFKISLPTYENGEIAFEFMEKYILNLKDKMTKFITMSK